MKFLAWRRNEGNEKLEQTFAPSDLKLIEIIYFLVTTWCITCALIQLLNVINLC